MFERMAALVAAGALVQATADFFLREQMAAGMLALAEQGLVHVLSSDAHSSAAAARCDLAGASSGCARSSSWRPHLEWIAETAPRAIVDGDELEPPFAPDRLRLGRVGPRAGAARPARRELLDHRAGAAAEAVAEEVGGAGRGAECAACPPTRARRRSSAASAPIIESPQPSREPRSNRGGISSQALAVAQRPAPARRRG